MLPNQMQMATEERRHEMGREVQRIGLGFLTTPEERRGTKWSPKQWLGIQLERFGRRLQDGASPARTLATVRGEAN